MDGDNDSDGSPLRDLEATLGRLRTHAARVQVAEDRLRALLESSRLITSHLELPAVLREVVIAATRLVGVPYGALGVIGPNGSLSEFVHVGVPPQAVEEMGQLPKGRGLLGAVVRDAQTIRLPDLLQDPRSVGLPAHHPPMRAFLGVPVRTHTEVYGNLYLTKPEPGNFSIEDERIIEALAATAGIAIENARLYEDARRQRRLSNALSHISSALLDPHDVDALQVIAKQCASVIPSVAVTVVVPDDDPHLMRVRVASGPLAASLLHTTFARAESLAFRAMELGEVVSDDAPVRDLPPGEVRLGPTAAVTLVARGRNIGALCVSKELHSPPFTGEEIDIVGDFAAQAGIAISLAAAREDQEKLHLLEDRARIARDLHDTVIQRLFATGLALEHAAATTPEHAAILRRQVENIDAAISDIRTAISAIRTPAARTQQKLRDRIFSLVDEMAAALRIRPHLHFDGPVDSLITDELVEDVLAVAREGLSNIARHAHATRCAISINATGSEIRVLIEDNGVGLRDAPGARSGTANLRSRALARGGTSELRPNTDGGLTLLWRVPTPGDTTARTDHADNDGT